MKNPNLLNSLPIIIAVCLILSIVLGVGFLWPKFQDLSLSVENVEQKEKEFEYNKKYFSDLSHIKTELAEYETGFAKISSALPDDPDMSSLLNYLQRASSQSGLVLKGISLFTASLSDSDESPEVYKILFGLQVAGSYPSFKNFLSTLEESARIIEIENISFLSPDEGELFTFNLRIKVYSY